MAGSAWEVGYVKVGERTQELSRGIKVKRIEIGWKDILGGNDILWKKDIEIYKEEKRKLKGIYIRVQKKKKR